MKDILKVKKQVLFESLIELNWLDVHLFKLGTKLGAQDSTKQEIAESLLNFFIKNDVGNKIAKIKHALREEVEPYLEYDESGISELDRKYEKNLSEFPPALE